MYKGNKKLLEMTLKVIKFARESYEKQKLHEKTSQEKWERTIVKTKSGPLKGSWSCKRCNHLNRRSVSTCSACGTKHIDSKELKLKEKRENVSNFSIERWICAYCTNRNPIEVVVCENCASEKHVSKERQNVNKSFQYAQQQQEERDRLYAQQLQAEQQRQRQRQKEPYFHNNQQRARNQQLGFMSGFGDDDI